MGALPPPSAPPRVLPLLLPLSLLLLLASFPSSRAAATSADGSTVAAAPQVGAGGTPLGKPLPPAPPPGSAAMKQLFMHAPGYTDLNHGSFGSPPRSVIERQRALQDQAEARPDTWMRGGYEGILDGVRAELAAYLNANATDLSLVENASGGVNAVLRSIGWAPGDMALILSCRYGMVGNTLAWLADTRNVTVVEVHVRFPGARAPPEALSAAGGWVPLPVAVAEQLKSRSFRVAVFSHITSAPAALLPMERLSLLCKARGVPVLIDGAHALGQTRVDLKALERAGAHYWVGNGHKWLYTPKGSAVLWTSREGQGSLHPTVVSSAGDEGVVDWHSPYLNRFQYTGTRDYTPFAAVPAGMAFRRWVGEEAISEHNTALARWAEDRLSSLWGTAPLLPTSQTLFMGHARLPAAVATREDATRLHDELMDKHDIELCIIPVDVHGDAAAPVYYARLSGQLYLNRSDFERAGQAVLEALAGWGN